MLIKAILLGLVGIVGVIDSRLIGRQNIGRPLILSTLAGLVLGDVRQGVILGASLELISIFAGSSSGMIPSISPSSFKSAAVTFITLAASGAFLLSL